MKENLTIRECREIKETLLETLESLDNLITLKELQENYEIKTKEEEEIEKWTFKIFVYSLEKLKSYFKLLNMYDIDFDAINSIINHISIADQQMDYFSNEIEKAANVPELHILLPNLQEGLDYCIKTRKELVNELMEVINNALC